MFSPRPVLSGAPGGPAFGADQTSEKEQAPRPMTFQLDAYHRRRVTRRAIQGISAVLLPYDAAGRIDERGFRRHLRRTLDAGLRVAVNMDTGYIELLTPAEKALVLQWTAETSDRE